MLIDAIEAARILKISDKTVKRWVEQGVIPFKKNHGEVKFEENELKKWAIAKKLGTQNINIDSKTNEEIVDLPTALSRGGVYSNIKGESVEEVFMRVVEYFPFQSDEVGKKLFDQIIAREKLSSTGLGSGIAVPHPRQASDWGLGGSTISVFYLEKAIPFKALDQKDVTILFVLLSTSIKSHLKLLSKLSHFLHLPQNIDKLFLHPQKEDLLNLMES